MKKTLVFVFLAIAIVTCTILFVNRTPKKELPLQEQALEVLSKGGCTVCHSQTPDFPWYHSMPTMKKMIEESANEGVRAFDMDAALSQLDSQDGMSLPNVLRIEMIAENGAMPPKHFSILNWKAKLTKKEASIVQDWGKKYRRNIYPNGNASKFKDEPISAIPDVAHLAPDYNKVPLGEALFNDTRLSLDNSLSCASCHLLDKYGVDNEQLSDGVNDAIGTVNAPTVLNSVFNFVQFWDGRAATLAEQAAGPPVNPVEMASESFGQIVAKLIADKNFTDKFCKVYPEVSQETITDAIEHYERTLITPDGAFDTYLKGDENAISNEAKAGYKAFKERNCAGCHCGVNVGGLSYEYLGLKNDYFADRKTDAVIDDKGHFSVTSLPYDLHRFKVPGLRNVAHTWPYFHDGTKNTLEEAVEDMAWYQEGIEISEEETAKIVSFLKTL
ncbi:MAG: heme-binding domain-containing protein [Bacteroidales bacterium]|nr:heme-binding domain-containing protein [Bacteroidales bacterium]